MGLGSSFSKVWNVVKWILPPLAITEYLFTTAMEALIPKQEFPGAPVEDLVIPTSEYGTPVPEILGITKVSGNIIWYDNARSKGRKEKGYQYFLTWAMKICTGPVDELYAIFDGQDKLWSGSITPPSSGGMVTLSLLELKERDSKGLVHFYFGTEDQQPNSVIGQYLDDSGLNTPNRRFCWVLFEDCYLGRSNRLKGYKFLVRRTPDLPELTGTGAVRVFNYNPAYAVWYILTQLLEIPPSLLNTASFNSVASTLSSEELGISILIYQKGAAYSYIANILKHIDGVLYYNSDGELCIKLRRKDQDFSNLPVVNTDSILKQVVMQKNSWLTTINKIDYSYKRLIKGDARPSVFIPIIADLVWVHWDEVLGEWVEGTEPIPSTEAYNFKTESSFIEDIGNQKTIGRVTTESIKYPLFNMPENVEWAADRTLRKRSYPLAGFSLVLNRNFYNLRPGSLFVLNYPKYNIESMVCRILELTEGSEDLENITISAVEDFEYISNTTFIPLAIGVGAAIPSDVVALTNHTVIELPYEVFVDQIALGFLCPKPNQYYQGFVIHMSSDGSAYYEIAERSQYVAYGTLVYDYPADTYTIDDLVGFTIDFSSADVLSIESIARDLLLTKENYAVLGDELITFQTITAISGFRYNITGIYRGRFDTEKKAHTAGAAFYFLGTQNLSLVNAEITGGATRYFKLVPWSDTDEGSIDDASAISITPSYRAETPYTPSNFQANDMGSFRPTYSTDIALSWAPRVRGAGAGAASYETTDSAPTYEGLFQIEVWVSDVLVRTITGINAMSWTYTSTMNTTDNGALADILIFKLINYFDANKQSDSTDITVRKKI